MKAVVLYSPKRVEIKEVKTPVPKENEALIKVRSAGICGSDIGAYRGLNPLVSYPRVLGHEIAGEISEIGENAIGLKVGDHVILDPYKYCRQCYPCSIGRTNCCENLQVIGVHIDGGMQEYIAYPVNMLIKVPIAMSWDYVPLAEPLTIALHAVHRTRFKAGEHIAINGAGAVGLLIAMSSIAYGGIPILIDLVEERLDYAEQLGIVNTIDISKQDLIKRIFEITNGRMAEVVVEASGSNVAIRNTLDMVSYAGRIAFTGWPKKETSLPTDIITKKELDILGSRVSVGEFEEAIELIYSEKIKANAILSKVISLEQIPEIIQEQAEHPERYIKVNALM